MYKYAARYRIKVESSTRHPPRVGVDYTFHEIEFRAEGIKEAEAKAKRRLPEVAKPFLRENPLADVILQYVVQLPKE